MFSLSKRKQGFLKTDDLFITIYNSKNTMRRKKEQISVINTQKKDTVYISNFSSKEYLFGKRKKYIAFTLVLNADILIKKG